MLGSSCYLPLSTGKAPSTLSSKEGLVLVSRRMLVGDPGLSRAGDPRCLKRSIMLSRYLKGCKKLYSGSVLRNSCGQSCTCTMDIRQRDRAPGDFPVPTVQRGLNC